MNEQTKEIERLRARVIELEAIVRHEAQSRRRELKGRDREIRHLSIALFRKSEEIRKWRSTTDLIWKDTRRRMAAAGLDVQGRPLKTNGVKHDTIPPPPKMPNPSRVFFVEEGCTHHSSPHVGPSQVSNEGEPLEQPRYTSFVDD